jgi:hypothetical protein
MLWHCPDNGTLLCSNIAMIEGGGGSGMTFTSFDGIILGTFAFLILLERLCCELRSNWKRRIFLRRYAHTEKVPFALREGETIAGVREEQNTLYFYVGNHKKDEKEYE